MIEKLTNLKHALVSQANRNEVVANNLANINTNGFKKDVMFFDFLDKKAQEKPEGQQSIDFSQGTLKQTNNDLDFALSGRGFFVIETEEGSGYTRQGHFKLDKDGTLIDSANRPVMGENGPITVIGENFKPNTISAAQNGEIFADDQLVGRLRIVDFENIDDLKKAGGNLFTADETLELDIYEPTIHQGFLEESNVNPADEMIQLIEVQRQFEGIQKMVRSLDEVFRMAASRVGKY